MDVDYTALLSRLLTQEILRNIEHCISWLRHHYITFSPQHLY